MAKKGGAPTKSEVLTHNLQRHRALPQAGRRRLRLARRCDQEKPARVNGLFTMPGLLKMKVVKKAGDQGPRRHQTRSPARR